MSSTKHLQRLAEAPAYLLPAKLASRIAAWSYERYHQLVLPRSLHRTAIMVQLALAEPAGAALKIARASYAAKGRARSNYRSMAQTSVWPEAQTNFAPAVHAALANTQQPLVMLTLHQADYLAGLLSVLRLIPLQRDIHIIKLAEWTRIEEDAYSHFRNYGHNLVIHRLSDRPAKRIVRALQRGAILVTFVDVPREFGTTAPVELFGLPYRLTSGPLAMARLASARVLPLFANYDADGHRHMSAGSFIHSLTNGRKQSVPELAQQLANQIETNLRTYPEQWEMWPVLDNLLDREALTDGTFDFAPDAIARLNALGATPATPANAAPPRDEPALPPPVPA